MFSQKAPICLPFTLMKQAFRINLLLKGIFHLFQQWTAFLIYYRTKFGVYQALLANTGSTLPGFLEFFFIKHIQSNRCQSPKSWAYIQSNRCQSPKSWAWQQGKHSKVLNSVFSPPKISHSSLKTIRGSSYTNFKVFRVFG